MPQINRKALLNNLRVLQPSICSNKVIEHADSIIFQGEKIYAFNDWICIQQPSLLKIEGIVKAAPLLDVLTKSTAEELTVEVSDGMLLLLSKKTCAKIPLLPETDSPAIKIKIPRKWQSLPPNIREGLKLCRFSASKDMSNAILTAIHVAETKMISTDNYRATRVELISPVKETFNLPAESSLTLIQYPIVTYAVDEAWLHFTTGDGLIFSCRKIEGEYPSGIDALFDVSGRIISFPEGVKEALERVGIFTEQEFDQDREVKITLKKNTLIVEGNNANGSYTERLSIKNTNDLSFHIHPTFLTDMIELTSTVIVGENRLVMKAKGFTHVTSLSSVIED